MKKISTIFLLLLLFSSTIFAQTQAEYTDRSEMVLSGNGQVLAVRGRYLTDDSLSEGGVYPIDFFGTQTGELIKSISNIIPSAKGIGLNYDGSLFSYYTNTGNSWVIDVQTEEVVMGLQGGGVGESGYTNWTRGNYNLVATFGLGASRVFDVDLKEQIMTNFPPLEGRNETIAVAISNNGQWLAESVQNEGTAYLAIWDILNISDIDLPRVLLESIGANNISWNFDNVRVASNTKGGIKIANIETANFYKLNLANPDEVIISVAWSLDGTKIAGGSRNNMVWVWDVTTGTIIANYLTEFPVTSVAWSPDGRRLYHTGGTAGVYINGLPLAEAIALENAATPTP